MGWGVGETERPVELSVVLNVLNLSAAENLARNSEGCPVLLRHRTQAGYRVPKLRSHSPVQRPAGPICLSGFLTILQQQNLKSTGVRLCMT